VLLQALLTDSATCAAMEPKKASVVKAKKMVTMVLSVRCALSMERL
jgi:hypothetical protein